MASFEFNPQHAAFIEKNFTSGFKFRATMLMQLPMGYLSGMRVKELNENRCTVQLKYKWLNKNPFKSTFWAVMGIAAEMTTGALLMRYTYKQKPSISMLVGSQSGNFHKKGVGKMTFVCEAGQEIKAAVFRAAETGEAVQVTCPVKGYNSDKELICDFEFVWSLKARSKK